MWGGDSSIIVPYFDSISTASSRDLEPLEGCPGSRLRDCRPENTGMSCNSESLDPFTCNSTVAFVCAELAISKSALYLIIDLDRLECVHV